LTALEYILYISFWKDKKGETMEEIRDRYVTFSNIDCYKNAVEALDAMKALFKEYPHAYNSFWERFYEHRLHLHKGTKSDTRLKDYLI